MSNSELTEDDPTAEEPRLTPEQIAGRPLVDLTVPELRKVAAQFDVESPSKLKRDELLGALGASPDDLTDEQRVAAALELSLRENEEAPSREEVDKLYSFPLLDPVDSEREFDSDDPRSPEHPDHPDDLPAGLNPSVWEVGPDGRPRQIDSGE